MTGMNRGRLARSGSALAIAALLLSSACGSSTGADPKHRMQPLKTFDGSAPKATHVADFSRQIGPQTKTVTIPADSVGILVRFDCLGDGEKFMLHFEGFGISRAGHRCDEIGDGVLPYADMGTASNPAVHRGDTVRITVQVGPKVRWSLGVDLTPDEATEDRLINPQSYS